LRLGLGEGRACRKRQRHGKEKRSYCELC
jgi:hypothetical protein